MDYKNMKKVLSENIRKFVYVPTTEYRENDVIFQKGDEGDAMFEVLTGEVGIYIHYGEENQKLLAVKHGGEYFGEIALLENRPRTATIVAHCNTSLRRISSAAGFLYYICQNPEKLEEIMNGMSERFKIERRNYLSSCKLLAEYRESLKNGTELTEEQKTLLEKYTQEGEKQRKKPEE